MNISSTTSTTSTTELSTSNNTTSAKSDASFKNEMDEISKSSKNNEEVAENSQTDNTKNTDKNEKVGKNSDTDKNVTQNKQTNSDNSGKDAVSNNQKNLSDKQTKLNKTEKSNLGKQSTLNAGISDEDSTLAMFSMQNLSNFEQNGINQNEFNTNINTLLAANKELSNLTQTTQLYGKIDYSDSSMQMTMEDAKFFVDLAQNPTTTLQNVMTDIQQNSAQTTQNIQHVNVSATLLNNIAEATKTNQPLRIDFDKDISVILKVDKDGALSANFIPGDKAVEEYLKQNISMLRQNFDNQELPYKELSYSKQQQQQNRENNRKNNKENEHE